MRVTYEYFRLFTKIMLSNKIGFVWFLIFPLVFFFVYNSNWFIEKPDVRSFYYQTSLFISYITFVMSIDVTTSLIFMRENGFLKMFKFVSGNKYAIMFGKISNQLTFLLIAILIFSLTTGSIFLLEIEDIVVYVSVSLVACLIGAVTISFFLLNLMLIPIKQESLTVILNIILLILFFLSAKDLNGPNNFLTLINPLDYVRNISYIFTEWFTGLQFNHIDYRYTFMTSGCYFIFGLVGVKFANINSMISRT